MVQSAFRRFLDSCSLNNVILKECLRLSFYAKQSKHHILKEVAGAFLLLLIRFFQA